MGKISQSRGRSKNFRRIIQQQISNNVSSSLKNHKKRLKIMKNQQKSQKISKNQQYLGKFTKIQNIQQPSANSEQWPRYSELVNEG